MWTRSQEYAQQIYQQMATVPDSARTKYGTMAHKLPVLIRTAGLAQALAFVDSRGSDEQKLLLDHLADVLKLGDGSALLAKSRMADLPEYMRLTREVQAAMVWYKRFAQSILGVEAGDDSDGGTES